MWRRLGAMAAACGAWCVATAEGKDTTTQRKPAGAGKGAAGSPEPAPVPAATPTKPTATKAATSTSSDADAVKSAADLLYKHLLNQRVILLTGRVDDKMANACVQSLLYLAKRDPEAPVQIYISSAGGSVFAAMAIIDMMAAVPCPVHTAVFGHAESAAAIILGAGERGHRCVSKHSRVMIHQPYTSYSSVKFQDRDMIVRAEELGRTRQLLEELVAEHSGKPLHEVRAAMAHNTYLNAAEAVSFGIVDNVCSRATVTGPRDR